MGNEKEGCSIGGGTILLCFIAQLVYMIYYSLTTDNTKTLLWSIPLCIVFWGLIGLISMYYEDKKKNE